MATVNIGSLKFNWKGAYNGSTAYAVDDVTEYNGSSYICILASTGNLPTNTTYFQPMATKGTDGTNVGTTITTQGDILYRDGSGLQRLAAGTSGQVLQTGGTGANPSWGTLSSDLVKIDSGSFSSVSYIDLDGTAKWGTAGTYARHKLVIYNLVATESTDIYARQIASGSLETGSHYSWVVSQRNSGNTSHGATAGDSVNTMKFTHDQIRGANHGACSHSLEFEIGGLQKVGSGSNNNQLQMLYRSTGSNQDGTKRQIMHLGGGITVSDDGINASRTGVRIYWGAGNATGNYAIYGFKV